jgi:hypothetical protein
MRYAVICMSLCYVIMLCCQRCALIKSMGMMFRTLACCSDVQRGGERPADARKSKAGHQGGPRGRRQGRLACCMTAKAAA